MPRLTEPPDKLLDLIYDAATEPELWSKALTNIADLTDSQGGVIFGQDVAAGRVYFDYNGGLDEDCNRTYRTQHVQNLWSTTMVRQPPSRVVFSDELVPLSVLRRTAFFHEVLRPQNIAHNAMILLLPERDLHGAFNVCRSARQGAFGEEERRLLSALLPHLRRSLLLEFRLDGYRALQGAAFHVLDRLSAGIILLDRTGRVAYANAAARAMSGDDGPLRLRDARVTTVSATHGQRLERLIGTVRHDTPVATMSISDPRDGHLFTILASSIRSRDIDRLAGLGMREPAVMLVVTDPLRPLDVPVEWTMDAYGLTRAEANVALIAASGASIPEIAHKLSVSPNTVKTHLRRVFAKTGVSRQAELARLMASLAVVRANGPISSERNGS